MDDRKEGSLKPLYFLQSASGRDVLWIASIALLYFGLARISLSLVFEPEGIAAIWPPAGIFLSAILLTRRGLRPWLVGALFLTDLIAEILAGTPVFVSLIYALVLTGDAVFSAWLLLHFVGEPISFDRVRELVGWLVLSVIFSNAIASLVAATAASKLLPGAAFWNSWKWWMASDGIGNLVVTPLILSMAAWGRTRWRKWNPKRLLEIVILIILLAVSNYTVFDRLSEFGLFSLLLIYLTFPFLLWAALRFGVRGTASATFILAAIAIYFASIGRSTFLIQGSPLDAVIAVQLYLVIMVVPALFLAMVVTERQSAVQGLLESEDKFKYVFDHSPVGKSITLPSGEIHVNQIFSDMIGYSELELQNKTWQEITHPDDIELTQKEVNALLSGEKNTARFTKRYIKKDGSLSWADVSTSLRRDKSGKPLYFMTALVDITEHKLAIEQLEESEILYRRLFEAAKDGILILDLESGAITDINSYLMDMLGYTADEILGKKLWEIGPFKDIAANQVVYDHLKQQEYIHYKSLPLLSKDGRLHQVEFVSNVYMAGKKQVIQCNIRDVTERKKEEEALQESEERFRAIFDGVQDAIMVESNEGRILAVNDRACEMFGYTREDFLIKFIAELVPEDHPIMAVGDAATPLSSMPFLTVNRRANGELFPVEITGREQTINREKVLLVVIRDITERKRAEQIIISSQKLLQEITDNSTSLIYALDSEGKFLLINRRLESVLGAPRETLISKPREAVLPPEFAAIHRANDLQVISDRKPITFEELNKETDGMHTYLSVKFPLVDLNGEVYGIGGVSTDITERIQAEEKLKEQLDELRRWHAVMIGREARVIELKHEVNTLLAQLGKPPLYPSGEEDSMPERK